MLVAFVFVLGGGAAAGWVLSLGADGLRRASANVELFDLPALQEPPALPAETAKVPDDAAVIGVSAGGRHRAYLVEALTPREGHCVNDRLGGVPVTVTYCDRSSCVRVFTDPDGTEPLAIAVGGWAGRYETGTLLLRIGKHRYRHTTGQPLEPDAPPFPYAEADCVQTTWKEWRTRHPDTDVYTGAH